MTISENDNFVKHLKLLGNIESNSTDRAFNGLEIEDLTLSWFLLLNFQFRNCTFKNISFEFIEINGSEFHNCIFDNCNFGNVTFIDSTITDCQFKKIFSGSLYFGMTSIENVLFEEALLQFTTFSDCSLHKLMIKKGEFHVGKFESGDFTYMLKSNVIFDSVLLWDIAFVGLDLTESLFENNSGGGLAFINSKLSPSTFTSHTTDRANSIDFLSIIQSENLLKETLKAVFGIADPYIKKMVSNSMTEPEFHTVFISYSFNDKAIAKNIKDLLDVNGLKTFLWENDAPGGMKMKKIMIDGIREYDKFLFIASKSSIKSEACHFEIDEAKKKYYDTWSDVLIPIHIDEYLFKVNKEDIPRKMADPYWDNITELKQFNSLDFTFIDKVTLTESNEQFQKLLRAMKIKSKWD